MRKGIDVSYAQGKLNWANIKTDFVIIKCNTGVNCPDVQLRNNATGASAYNIPIGYYHWGTFNRKDVVQDAKEEAEEFIMMLKTLPKYSIIPSLDVEEERVKSFDPDELQLWIMSFVSEMKKGGHDTMLYSYSPWLNSYLPKHHGLGHLPLWIAGYPWDFSPNPDGTSKAVYPHTVPVIPNNENEILKKMTPLPKGWAKGDYWQYSGQGVIPGINQLIDLVIKL